MKTLGCIEPAQADPFLDRITPYVMKFTDPKKCEAALQLGVFFDGTDNNMERDRGRFAHSNIAKLWSCYPHNPSRGIERLYVPGVGTEFNEINSPPEGWRGTAFGIGCEARVLFALLKTVDFMHRFALQGPPRFDKQQLRVLCKESNPSWEDDRYAINRLGYERGLQECKDQGQMRRTFFVSESERLSRRLAESAVKVTELVIDIFGFSRGAAEARIYASWLSEVLIDGKFACIPLTIRFMGLFDTVASAGMQEMLITGANNSTGGHDGWARKESLLIPKKVVNCVHFVAMHELRKNFPVDEISTGGVRPANCHEFAYPGAHSDIGGGYAPGDLGIAAGRAPALDDAMKLSQITLNHLFAYASAALVPLSKELARSTASYDPFAVAPELKRDFEAFISANEGGHKRLADWMETYLAWRWHIRETYSEVGHVQRATADRQFLLQANRKLIADAKLLLEASTKPAAKHVVKDLVFRPEKGGVETPPAAVVSSLLDKEATAVLLRAISLGKPSAVFVNFFDRYVHDSYAGFCKDLMEPSGYWRYRKGFQGSDQVLNADLNDGQEVSEIS
jgi:hypothetical protein